MNTERNMSKIPTTEEILLENFKGLVYPYVGSSMLVNHKDEGVIIKNANICLDLAKQFSSQENKELKAEIERLKVLAETVKTFLFAVSEGLVTVYPDSEDVIDFTQLMEDNLKTLTPNNNEK